jgi:hypothetical protein
MGKAEMRNQVKMLFHPGHLQVNPEVADFEGLDFVLDNLAHFRCDGLG